MQGVLHSIPPKKYVSLREVEFDSISVKSEDKSEVIHDDWKQASQSKANRKVSIKIYCVSVFVIN